MDLDVPKKENYTINVFFMSQFNYYQLEWMYQDRALNNQINRLHERSLSLVLFNLRVNNLTY